MKRKKIQIIVSANYHNVISAVLLWYVRRKTVVAEAITRKLSDQQSFVLDKQKTDTECRLCSCLWYVRRKTVVAESITRKLSVQQSFVLDKQKTDTLTIATIFFY